MHPKSLVRISIRHLLVRLESRLSSSRPQPIPFLLPTSLTCIHHARCCEEEEGARLEVVGDADPSTAINTATHCPYSLSCPPLERPGLRSRRPTLAPAPSKGWLAGMKEAQESRGGAAATQSSLEPPSSLGREASGAASHYGDASMPLFLLSSPQQSRVSASHNHDPGLQSVESPQIFVHPQQHSAKLDPTAKSGDARPELLREPFFPNLKDDAAAAGLESPNEMQKKDPLQMQIWRLYSRTKSQLPNQERMENLTWRMMAMNLKRKEREAATLYVLATSSLFPRPSIIRV